MGGSLVMGAWSEGPFCNDSILNDIGGLTYSECETQAIEKVLEEYESYLGNYELAALILDSSVGTHYICDRDTLKSLIDTINISVKDRVSHKNDNFYESREALLTFCTTSIEYRKQLVNKVLNKFNVYKKHNIYEQFLDSWIDPEPYRKLYSTIWRQLGTLQRNQNYSNAVVIDTDVFDKYVTIDGFFNEDCDDPGIIDEYLDLIEDNSIVVYGKKDEYSYIVSNRKSNLKVTLPANRIELLRQHNKICTVNNKLQVTVTNVIRKSNKIVGYTISDRKGDQRNVWADALKNAIRSNKVEVINYILTSDNRLMPSKKTIIGQER